MAVAFYVTGISTPEVHPESPPLLGTLTTCCLAYELRAVRLADPRRQAQGCV